MRKAPDNLQADGALGEQLSLLDPVPFCPAWPTKNTLPAHALDLLLQGNVFDHREFLDGHGSWRLAAVVFQLRALGWPIETIEVASPSPENVARTIARYKLPADVAAQALKQKPNTRGAHG